MESLRPLSAFEQLLADEIAPLGFVYAARPIATAPPTLPVGELWDAFKRFTLAPVDHTHPGAIIDTDTLVLETSPARAAAPNMPARPSEVMIERRLWVVDEDDNLIEEDLAYLAFTVDEQLADAVRTHPILWSLSIGGRDRRPGAREAWIADVEQSVFAELLAQPELVVGLRAY